MVEGAQPYALRPGEGRLIDLGDFEMTVKASATETVLNLYFPASMIGYFDDLAAALRQDDVNDHALDEIAVTHAMEIVGPASERYV